MTVNIDFPTEGTNIRWANPLPGFAWSLPMGKYRPAGFAAKRKFSFHTGVDLTCKHNQPLASVEDGIVIAIRDFTNGKKRKKPPPWLNKTRVILIEGETGVVAYCNVKERPKLKIGDLVDAGEIIGNVIRRNKKKRRKNRCMLHLELYTKETKRRVHWSYHYPKPPQLLDPTNYLVDIISQTQVVRRRLYKPAS